MKVPCSGLLPSIEVGLCYLRTWRRGESLLFILKLSLLLAGAHLSDPNSWCLILCASSSIFGLRV